MIKTKVNPLKLNEIRFLAHVHKKEGRYVKRYYFSNGLGASVVCHDSSYGGHAGCFELAILKYPHGTDPEITSEQHPYRARPTFADKLVGNFS